MHACYGSRRDMGCLFMCSLQILISQLRYQRPLMTSFRTVPLMCEEDSTRYALQEVLIIYEDCWRNAFWKISESISESMGTFILLLLLCLMFSFYCPVAVIHYLRYVLNEFSSCFFVHCWYFCTVSTQIGYLFCQLSLSSPFLEIYISETANLSLPVWVIVHVSEVLQCCKEQHSTLYNFFS